MNTSNVLNNTAMGASDLSGVYDNFIKKPNLPHEYSVRVAHGFTDYEIKSSEEVASAHEAGFDALMTGTVFFKSLALLNVPGKNLVSPTLHWDLGFYKNKVRHLPFRSFYFLKFSCLWEVSKCPTAWRSLKLTFTRTNQSRFSI
jgi:CAF1 family ribonuclease